MLRKAKKKVGRLFLTIPIIIMVTIIVVMLSSGVTVAFQIAFVENGGISFGYIAKLFSKKQFLQSIFFTVYVSLVSTVISFFISIIFSDFLSRKKYGHNIIIKAVTILPYIAAVAIFINAFGEGGFIWYLWNSITNGTLTYGTIKSKSGISIILLFLYKVAPFLIISFTPIFTDIYHKYYAAAHNLGCKKWDYFRFVLLPISKRSLLSNFILLFNFMIFSFEPYQFLGSTIPKGLGVLANEWYRSANAEHKKLGMTLNFFMMILGFVGAVIYIRLMFRNDENE